VGIYWQKWVAAVVTVAWCGDDADRYIAPAGQSGSIDVCVPPKGSMAPHLGFPSFLTTPCTPHWGKVSRANSYFWRTRNFNNSTTHGWIVVVKLHDEDFRAHFYEKLGKLYFLVAAKHAAQ